MKPVDPKTAHWKYNDDPELAPQQIDLSTAPEVVKASDEQYYLQLDGRVVSDLPQSVEPLEGAADRCSGLKKEAESGGSPEQDILTSGTALKGRGLRSRRAVWAVAGVAIVISIAIGLGVGLGVGLRHQKQNSQSTSDPSAASPSNVSSTPAVCVDGIRYCGWSLIQDMGYARTYLSSTGSLDPYNDLFQCGAGNALILNQSCGGPYQCQPPEFEKNGCSKSTQQSCCGKT